MQAWVLFTLLAAFMQACRTAGQKRLSQQLTPLATTLVRYLFGLPVVLVYLYWLLPAEFDPFYSTVFATTFLLYASMAAVAQILATFWLVKVLSYRNFAVGSSLVKTEAVQTALLGALIFQEQLSLWGWMAVLIAGLGVLVMTLSGKRWQFDRYSAFYGLLSGLAFAFTSLWLRQASLSLGYAYTLNAALTLAYMVTLQSVLCLLMVYYKERNQLGLMLKNAKLAMFIGATSALGSIGWFSAMTYQNAALVKTLGQVEIVFTLLITWFYFNEKLTKRELSATVLIVMSVILLFQ